MLLQDQPVTATTAASLRQLRGRGGTVPSSN
jgi:hypothetical protein